MLKSIEIIIISIDKEMLVKIDPVNKQIVTSLKTYQVSDDVINNFLRIIRTWKGEYLGNTIDGERFTIKIDYDNTEEVIKGNGKYPDNYLEFKHFIEAYYD